MPYIAHVLGTPRSRTDVAHHPSKNVVTTAEDNLVGREAAGDVAAGAVGGTRPDGCQQVAAAGVVRSYRRPEKASGLADRVPQGLHSIQQCGLWDGSNQDDLVARPLPIPQRR